MNYLYVCMQKNSFIYLYFLYSYIIDRVNILGILVVKMN